MTIGDPTMYRCQNQLTGAGGYTTTTVGGGGGGIGGAGMLPNTTWTPVYMQFPQEFPEAILLSMIAMASLQGLRAAGDKRSSAEIALQAYRDAQALIKTMKQISEVTKALQNEER